MDPSASTSGLSKADELRLLREANYDATVTCVQEVHSDLRIIRVVPDKPFPQFLPGQYAALGLGSWEPRVAGVDGEAPEVAETPHLIKRAYSISCPLLDQQSKLIRASELPYLEFYISLVRHVPAHPPALTPRLFALREGSRLFLAGEAKGNYILEGITNESDLLFLATGTGEAPHNAMIAALLADGHRGRIASAVSVRYRQDAAYHAAHETLERENPNYRYLVLTTREPENLDANHPQFAGKRHLQDLVRSGELERWIGWNLDPIRTHVFLCGSPAMIGTQRGKIVPGGMLELLSSRGFFPPQPHRSGNLHMEHYW